MITVRLVQTPLVESKVRTRLHVRSSNSLSVKQKPGRNTTYIPPRLILNLFFLSHLMYSVKHRIVTLEVLTVVIQYMITR